MKAKQILFFFVFVFITVCAGAQLGFRLGGNVSNLSYKNNDNSSSQDPDYKVKLGFNAGFIYNFGKIVAFQPGLYFSQKGFMTKEGDDKAKYIFNYVEIPLNILYKIDAKGYKVYGGLGPVFSYAVGGNERWKHGEESGDSRIIFKSRPDYYTGTNIYFENAFDMGAQIVAGIEFGRISLNLNYNLGLLRLNDEKTYSDGSKLNIVERNRTFGFTLGFVLGRNQ